VAIVILLGLVAALWVVVLAPSVWRRYGERQGVGSIESFHHQLQLLEHAGPKTVAPAYRLHTALPGGSPGPEATPTSDSSRPKLVLLRPTEDAAAADVDDDEGCHYERVGVLDRPEPVCLPEAGADLRLLRRDQARRRFSTLLRCLGGVAVSTFIIGLWPGMHVAWIFTALTGLPALALLGLMAYANELKEERRRRGSQRRGAALDAVEYIDRAGAGYPGAWDDDEPFEGRQAAAR
jgi:hypothetical protein